jgi:hypothetical protein
MKRILLLQNVSKEKARISPTAIFDRSGIWVATLLMCRLDATWGEEDWQETRERGDEHRVDEKLALKKVAKEWRKSGEHLEPQRGKFRCWSSVGGR